MLVAVYGTLKSGYGNHLLLEGSKFIGEYRVPYGLFRYCPHFPSLSLKTKGHTLVEVYEVDGDTLARLDILEGYPSFYDRSTIKVHGIDEPVYVYHIDDYVENEIEEGVF